MVKRILTLVISVILVIVSVYGLFFKSECYEYKNLAYGSHERQKLDLNIPKEHDGETGLVLFIHGGGWVYGDKDTYDDELDNFSDEAKYASASMNYRFIDDNIHIEDILDDIDLALKCIKEKALERGLNINKVLLTGHSAGGHLSMLYAYSRAEGAEIKPVAVVSNCGPTYFTNTNFYVDSDLGETDFITDLMSKACGKKFTFDTLDSAKDELLKISPITYVNENTVPTVINHGQKDTVVPYEQALKLQQKFEEFGVKYDLNPFPSSNHDLKDDSESSKKAKVLLEQYCNDYLN